MALETTFRELPASLLKLHEALDAVHVAVGDQPVDDEAAIADGIESATLDVLGVLHEARQAAGKAVKAVGHPVDLDKTRRALADCQERCLRIEHQFSMDLVSYEKLRELARLGAERRHEWLPWSNSLRQAIEDCRAPLQSVSLALSACWQELAERLGTTNISVQTTNVGQQISVAKPKVEDFEIEGVT